MGEDGGSRLTGGGGGGGGDVNVVHLVLLLLLGLLALGLSAWRWHHDRCEGACQGTATDVVEVRKSGPNPPPPPLDVAKVSTTAEQV